MKAAQVTGPILALKGMLMQASGSYEPIIKIVVTNSVFNTLLQDPSISSNVCSYGMDGAPYRVTFCGMTIEAEDW